MSQRRRKTLIVAATAVFVAVAFIALRGIGGVSVPDSPMAAGRLPKIRPDISGVIVPSNMAPLNFLVEEPGKEFRVRIHGESGVDFVVGSTDAKMEFPQSAWRDALEKNRGGKLSVEAFVKGDDGSWTAFDAMEIAVAKEKIDSHLVYRLLGPLCNLSRHMGIYQRNLENFDETPILVRSSVGGCLNCHAFADRNPERFSFHVRMPKTAKKGVSGMIYVHDGAVERVQTKSEVAPKPPGYLSWHPNGEIAAFSMNVPKQIFREAGDEFRDVYDVDSDLAVVNAKTGKTSTSPAIADADRLETFPAWSADGKTLFYCSAKLSWKRGQAPPLDVIPKIKYDLMRISYDADKEEWGKPETVVSAADVGMSVSQPKASPDGRFLLFCMMDYGAFPAYRPASDLYMLDLKSGERKKLECNSDRSESWHSWSSDSRWIVFSSRRDDGLLARPYICRIDEQGRASKPFPLPQKDPTFYDSCVNTYNVPELVSGSIDVGKAALIEAVQSRSETAAEGTSKAESQYQVDREQMGHN